MPRYLWLVAPLLVVVIVAGLYWMDSAEEAPPPALPLRIRPDAGAGWQPHPDRAGLPRRKLAK